MDEEILNTTEEIENEEEPVVEANTQSADVSANSTSSSEEITRILQLIKTRTLEAGDTSISWKDLVEFLKNESTHLGHAAPINESDFGGITTLFNQIDNKADMDNTNEGDNPFDYDKFVKRLVDNPQLNFWNESVGTLVRKVADLLGSSEKGEWSSTITPNSGGITYADTPEGEEYPTAVTETDGTIGISNGSLKEGFRVRGIKNANAGNFFNKKDTTSGRTATWVIPNYNIDAATYDGVRGNDRMMSALESHKEMQFTHTQDQSAVNNNMNKYLRLIMPKYLRRVEVEDLNRNFWVIGQTLTAISAFLFDENGPLPEIFKGILSEITQLWENIMYLWVSLAAEQNATKYTKVHTEVVYLPNNELEDHMSYDNFISSSDTIDWNTIESRLSYLIDSYPECNLCIIPVYRRGNYKHNYYNTEVWPGILLYDRNINNGKFCRLSWWNPDDNRSEGRFYIPEDLAHCVTGFYEKNNKWYIKIPFSELKDTETEKEYCAAVRSIPTVNVTYENGKFVINDFRIDFYDMCLQKLHSDEDVSTFRVAWLGMQKSGELGYTKWEIDVKNKKAIGYYKDGTFQEETVPDIIEFVTRSIDAERSQDDLGTTSSTGYYLGEMISSFDTSEIPSLDTYTPVVEPLNFTPLQDYLQTGYGGTDGIIGTIKTTNVNHIKAIHKTLNEDDDKIYLYTAQQRSGLYKGNQNVLGSYYAHNKTKQKTDNSNNYERYVKSGKKLTTVTGSEYDDYNRYRETVKVGALLSIPRLNKEPIAIPNYTYIYKLLHTIEPLAGTSKPQHWVNLIKQGSSNGAPGRMMASFCTILPNANNKLTLTRDRHGGIKTIYYWYTKNGADMTKDNWRLIITNVTYNYGVFPQYRTFNSNYAIEGTQNTNFSDLKQFLPDWRNVPSYGAYKADSYTGSNKYYAGLTANSPSTPIEEPINWSPNFFSNESYYLPERLYGWEMTKEDFENFLGTSSGKTFIVNKEDSNFFTGGTRISVNDSQGEMHFTMTSAFRNKLDSIPSSGVLPDNWLDGSYANGRVLGSGQNAYYATVIEVNSTLITPKGQTYSWKKRKIRDTYSVVDGTGFEFYTNSKDTFTKNGQIITPHAYLLDSNYKLREMGGDYSELFESEPPYNDNGSPKINFEYYPYNGHPKQS